jgi:hypothetical protein
VLVEPKVKWSKERALANAEFFGDLSKQEDKDILYREIGGILVDFLIAAVRQLNNDSQNSLDHGSAAQPSNENIGAAQPTIMATGTDLFVNSLPTTSPTMSVSPGGL